MPIARFQMPDGRVARFEVPEGTTPEQAQSMIAAQVGEQQPEVPEQDSSMLGDLAAGAIRGAGSIGATILSPIDAAARAMGVQNSWVGLDRRQAMDEGLRRMGADPTSTAFALGKIGTEIAGTAGAGGVLAKGAQAIPMLARTALPAALRTGGFGANIPMAARIAGGGATGAAMAGMVNPEDAGKGAVLGAALPVGFRAAGVVGEKAVKPIARKLMQSAIKPTIEQLRKGEAGVAIDTLLKYGISPTQKGVEKLRANVDDINQQIAQRLKGSNAVVNRDDVINYLGDVRNKFGTQVNPVDDLNAIQRASDEFRTQFPAMLPVQKAQELKQGTYKALAGKYGEAGSAATESQKALARGLKEKIADVVPGIGQLNAEEANLLKTLKVTERRALMELNKNPVGLSALASNPIGFAAFMADRSAAFKALAARMVNRSAGFPQQLEGKMTSPALRAGLLSTQTD